MATSYTRNSDDELALTDGDERLPWLESGEEDEAVAGVDAGRLVLMGGVALLVLLAVVGGIWLVSNRGAGSAPDADGSVIAAPEGPYKTRPNEEGGKVFQGTGDTSFAVGEGQTREGQLADRPAAAPMPSVTTTLDAPEASPSPAQASGGAGVQVGAFPRREDAEAGWTALVRQTEALSGVSHRVIEAQSDIGRVFRLQAVTGNRASATRLCAALKADGLACFVK